MMELAVARPLINTKMLGHFIAIERQKKMDRFQEVFEEQFSWLSEVMVVAKEAFASSEIVLLPKTPSLKRCRADKNQQEDTTLEDEENVPPKKTRRIRSPGKDLEEVECAPSRPERCRQPRKKPIPKKAKPSCATRSSKRNAKKEEDVCELKNQAVSISVAETRGINDNVERVCVGNKKANMAESQHILGSYNKPILLDSDGKPSPVSHSMGKGKFNSTETQKKNKMKPNPVKMLKSGCMHNKPKWSTGNTPNACQSKDYGRRNIMQSAVKTPNARRSKDYSRNLLRRSLIKTPNARRSRDYVQNKIKQFCGKTPKACRNNKNVTSDNLEKTPTALEITCNNYIQNCAKQCVIKTSNLCTSTAITGYMQNNVRNSITNQTFEQDKGEKTIINANGKYTNHNDGKTEVQQSHDEEHKASTASVSDCEMNDVEQPSVNVLNDCTSPVNVKSIAELNVVTTQSNSANPSCVENDLELNDVETDHSFENQRKSNSRNVPNLSTPSIPQFLSTCSSSMLDVSDKDCIPEKSAEIPTAAKTQEEYQEETCMSRLPAAAANSPSGKPDCSMQKLTDGDDKHENPPDVSTTGTGSICMASSSILTSETKQIVENIRSTKTVCDLVTSAQALIPQSKVMPMTATKMEESLCVEGKSSQQEAVCKASVSKCANNSPLQHNISLNASTSSLPAKPNLKTAVTKSYNPDSKFILKQMSSFLRNQSRWRFDKLHVAYVKDFASYEMTPPRKYVQDNYDITDMKSDDSTDDEEAPKKTMPTWAKGNCLRALVISQTYRPPDLDKIFDIIEPLDLAAVFKRKKKRFYKRTSSAIWNSPILKPSGQF